jgi:hypothetical protein
MTRNVNTTSMIQDVRKLVQEGQEYNRQKLRGPHTGFPLSEDTRHSVQIANPSKCKIS